MKTMKRIKFLKHSIVFMLTVLLLSGCGSTGTLKVTIPPAVKLNDYKTILIYVSSQVPDATRETIELESVIVGMLQKKRLFEKVIHGSASPGASADLQLNARIVKLKKVSFGTLIIPIVNLVSFFPRSNNIVVDAEIVDLETGKTISTFITEGKSVKKSAVDLYYERKYISQAIKRVAEEIAEFLQKNI